MRSFLASSLLLLFVLGCSPSESARISSSFINTQETQAAETLPGAPLVLLPEGTDAQCLDGSPAGYYLKSAPTNSPNKDKWVIFLQGGGWCTSLENCYERTKTNRGTSTVWGPEKKENYWIGPLSWNCTRNPTFCDWNLVFINYCDGVSFSGHLDSHEIYTNPSTGAQHKLYFRGAIIRKRVLEHLNATTSIGSASRALIAGSSAGGLSTFLHYESIAQWVLENTAITKIKVMPLSGFFLNQPNVNYYQNFFDMAGYMVPLANATGSLNAACIADHPAQPQVCFFAEVAFSYSTSQFPVFVINSQVDWFQIHYILLNADNSTDFVPNAQSPYNQCLSNKMDNKGFKGCTQDDMRPILWYQQAFLNRFYEIEAFRRPGYGAYISSCFTHISSIIHSFYEVLEVGGVKMNEAVDKWYHSDDSTPAALNTYVDCRRNLTQPNYECNPTCKEGWENIPGVGAAVEGADAEMGDINFF